MAAPWERDRVLTVMAVLTGLLSISNFTKALQHLNNPEIGGIVIFGVRFESTLANLLLGPLMGLVLARYSYGLWHRKRWLVPFSAAYAFYVPTNLILFWYFQTGPQPPVGFIVAYLAVALSGSIGTALYIAHHKDELA